MIGESIPRHHESSTSTAEHCRGRHRWITVKRKVHVVLLGGWSPGPLPYLVGFFSNNISTSRSTTTTTSREEDPASSSVAAPSTPTLQYDVDVVDITPNLPMPPIPSTVWCCCTFNNPRLLMAWIVFGGLIYLLFFLPSIMVSETSSPSKVTTFLRIVVSVITIIWFRFVVVPTVVRASVDKGIEVALQQQSTLSSSSQRWLLSGIGSSTTTSDDHDFQDGGNEAGPTTILIGFSWGGAVRRQCELFVFALFR